MSKKQLTHEDLPGLTPAEIIEHLNTGAVIVNATFPFIKDLFGKIKELVSTIQTDKLSTPRGKRLAIEKLQDEVEILNAKDIAQKELNKLYDSYFEQLKQKGVIE